MYYFSTLFCEALYMFRSDLLSSILTSLADRQRNQYDKYQLLWIQY